VVQPIIVTSFQLGRTAAIDVATSHRASTDTVIHLRDEFVLCAFVTVTVNVRFRLPLFNAASHPHRVDRLGPFIRVSSDAELERSKSASRVSQAVGQRRI